MKKSMIIIFLIVSGSAFSYDFPSPSDSTAKLVFNHSSAAKQIFPVKLLEVNGENVSVRNDAAWLNPGQYELNFASSVDSRYVQTVLSPKERRGTKDWNTEMRINLEAGKTYYIGFDASSNNTEDWQPVIYKVKSSNP